MHRTYVAAAVLLHKAYPSLVSLHSLASICESALEEFNLGRVMYHEFDKPGWSKAEEAMSEDIEEAHQLLQAGGIALSRYKTRETLVYEEKLSLSDSTASGDGNQCANKASLGIGNSPKDLIRF